MNELIEFCNKYDCTFRIKYEKCFYEFVIKILKIHRTIHKTEERSIEGSSEHQIVFKRNGDLFQGIKIALKEANRWINENG